MRTRYADIPTYLTKDGSEIRELMHPSNHGASNQSLAEATIHPGETTRRHRHQLTEEIYHVSQGEGIMTLGEQHFAIGPGDTILIPPGTPHCVKATGTLPLKMLCACAPAYSHTDTEILANDGNLDNRADIA
jgi:mannose-6-phosphate isomerase-like protein (cupin superfamily)